MSNVIESTEKVLDYGAYTEEKLRYGTFTIVIPAYNEIKRLPPVLYEVCNFISYNGLPWNIIVSVDGDDGTYEFVEVLSGKFSFVHVLSGNGREGMGGAIKHALLFTDSDYVILMDADGSSHISDIMTSLGLVEWYDIVNFNRYDTKENSIPFRRRFASRVFNLMLKIIFNISVSDTQCGYKIMRRSSVLPIVNSITFTNAFFLSALFLHGKRNKLKISEVPIRYDHTNGSKFTVSMTSISYIVSLIGFAIRNSKVYFFIPDSIKELYYKKFRYL